MTDYLRQIEEIGEMAYIQKLLAEGKLNPIYMDECYKDFKELMLSALPTYTMTATLYRYSVGRLELSEEQLNALISDIDTLKHHNIWDVATEQQTIEQCIESIEKADAYKRLSASDKAKYDDAVKRDMERTFNMKIDF